MPARTELIQAVVLPKLVLRSALPIAAHVIEGSDQTSDQRRRGRRSETQLALLIVGGHFATPNAKRSNHPRQDSGH